MGQLNSNEVPPNPFIHGWKGMVVAPPLPDNPPPVRTTQTVSPVQQVYRIVSQPLQPARYPAPRSPSFEWPVGFILVAGLVIALIAGIAVASKPRQPSVPSESRAATNQVSFTLSQNCTSPIQREMPHQPALQTIPVASPPVVQAPTVVTITQSQPVTSRVAEDSFQPAPSRPVENSYRTDEQAITATRPVIYNQQSQEYNNYYTVRSQPRYNRSIMPQYVSVPTINGSQRPILYRPQYSQMNTGARYYTQSYMPATNAVRYQPMYRYSSVPQYAPMATMNANAYRPTIYRQQQFSQANPGRRNYNWPASMPLTTYQPGYQQRMYYNSQFMPQVRNVPNYPSYRPPSTMSVPNHQWRMR